MTVGDDMLNVVDKDGKEKRAEDGALGDAREDGGS